MKRMIVAAPFIVGLTSHGQSKHEMGNHVILPNPKLLRCLSSDRAQLWQDKPRGDKEEVALKLFFTWPSDRPKIVVSRDRQRHPVKPNMSGDKSLLRNQFLRNHV